MGCAYKAKVYDAGRETSEHTRAFDEHLCWPHYVIARLLMEVRLQCFGKGQREDSWRLTVVPDFAQSLPVNAGFSGQLTKRNLLIADFTP